MKNEVVLKRKEIYIKISNYLDNISEKYNFRVSRSSKLGKPASSKKLNSREFRMQLIDKDNDTSNKYKEYLIESIRKLNGSENIEYNELSPNSSMFSSISFDYENINFDIVIARGANKGHMFEVRVLNGLIDYFKTLDENHEYEILVEKLCRANKKLSKNEVVLIENRVGSVFKKNIEIDKLGEIIGDIVLTDIKNTKWYLSLKNVNGITFSSYSGARIFNSDGKINYKSDGIKFLLSFGVDINLIQDGFDERNNIQRKNRKKYLIREPNKDKIREIFRRSWGMNYFYVKKTNDVNHWKVFWIDEKILENLSSNILVKKIKYPNLNSKQVSIFCQNNFASYLIELRNSHGGEYPDDIKFKILDLYI